MKPAIPAKAVSAISVPVLSMSVSRTLVSPQTTASAQAVAKGAKKTTAKPSFTPLYDAGDQGMSQLISGRGIKEARTNE